MKQTIKPFYTRIAATGMLLIATILGASAHADDIYKWVNEDNQVQYTQMPPPHGIKSIRIQRSTITEYQDKAGLKEQANPGQANAESTNTDAAGDVQENGQASEDRETLLAGSYEKNCEKARNNLASLNRGNVRLRTSDGKVVHLTEEERLQKIEETNAQIELFCNN